MIEGNVEGNSKEEGVSQDQVHDLIFNRELGWKEIIFDLINTEQLDPWDVDISILADRFFDRIEKYEEMDFFVSSKVILAASLLLRLKSELIMSKYLRSIDDILFGREEVENKRAPFERLELDEDIPELVPKSPMPRYKRVTLNDLIESLNKAIVTENRRIKKTIVNQNALRETGISLPKMTFGITERMKKLQSRLAAHFDANKSHKRIHYDTFVGNKGDVWAFWFFRLLVVVCFGVVWLEQEGVFEDIHIWMKHIYLKHNPDPFLDLKIDMSELTEEEMARLNEVEKLGDLLDEDSFGEEGK
jgi:segregation and condensation protein A